MTDLEEIRRQRDMERAHTASVEDAFRAQTQLTNQANAKVKYVTERAARSVKEACEILDFLHQRIEIMVDSWVLDILNLEKDPQKQAEKVAQIRAFTPQKMGSPVGSLPPPGDTPAN